MTVTLSADPERSVTIPITTMNEGGASNSDYSGVPANVTFASGETEQTFTFSATQDTEDDDDESVQLGFGNLPTGVAGRAGGTTVVSIADDDVPAVTVGFGQDAYTVAEGGTQTVTVTLSADPERSVTIPITTMNEGGGSNSDYSGVPANVTFARGETEQTFTFSATQDTEDDDDESVQLGFGNLPTGVSEGATRETVVSITDDDVPAVMVSFGQDAYTVAEGGTQTVTVTLSADPERSVTIPITTMNEGGGSNSDYSGVPANVTFARGETEQTFTFSATQDNANDDGESVKLTFGPLPTGVTEGATRETVVSITDDDVPAVTVSFGQGSYSVAEGSGVTVKVKLSADPERTVTIPLTATGHDGATEDDWSGVPESLTFDAGITSRSFTVTPVDDEIEDSGEMVELGFGTMPDGFVPGFPATARITIMNDDDVTTVTSPDCEGSIWCVTTEFGVHMDWYGGRKWLILRDLANEQFALNGITYGVAALNLWPNPGGVTNPRAPFAIPHRAKSRLTLVNLSATDRGDSWTMPNEDYLDWTLYISTDNDGIEVEAELPFNAAKVCCGSSWIWYGLDLDELNAAWEPGKLYTFRIVEDPRADRVAEVPGPPLYLEVAGVNQRNAIMRWVRPQMRNDGAPPGVKYKLQWKRAAGQWDTPADVSQHVYVPLPGEEALSWTTPGLLSPGTDYDMRVFAVNEVGDSAPSNVVAVTTNPALARVQRAESRSNTPATGGPGIIGTPRAGETLTATTEDIEDEDGLTGAVFAYQWIRRDPARRTDADIGGATGSTYAVTAEDAGKEIKVRVTLTDDAGNKESVTASWAVLVAPSLTIPEPETPPESTETDEAQRAQETAETPLTAVILNAPGSHDGQETFTFELHFSEELKEDFSYKTLRDHAFMASMESTVKGGSVVGARRLNPPSNIGWAIVVKPDSNGDVTVELRVTEDCDAQGAICTDDGTMLSSPLKFIVSGPGQ